MIRILIVDDLQSKREKIFNTILDNHDILEKDIVQAKCVKEAKKVLYQEYFDLMILDLVLPIEETGESNAKNATGFLNDIEINPSIHPPIHDINSVNLPGYLRYIKPAYQFSFFLLIHFSIKLPAALLEFS